jgi:hypothetical protein
MANLEQIFNNVKLTENGDLSFKSTLNPLLDILFMTEYFQKHINEVKIGTSDIEKLFSMFIRDPRYGLGRRDLGRELMYQSEVDVLDVIKAGRWDDIFYKINLLPENEFKIIADYCYSEIKNGNELLKKWMPRYASKNKALAIRFRYAFGMTKQQYGKFIKANTVEQNLSRKTTEEIDFEHVPSLAMIKYYKRFETGEDTKVRFAKYLEGVKKGEKKLNVSTTSVYDIYKNRDKIDCDLFFDKIEKISGSWIPVVDTSGSMWDGNDSIGKAISVSHYLAKCSSYAPNKVVSFSNMPKLITLGKDFVKRDEVFGESNSNYMKEINSMFTGDYTNTDFGAVCRLLSQLDANNAPDYIIVLSDMEFDCGSGQNKDDMMRIFKNNGMGNTKLIWWNFNARNTTCPETDKYGNIFLSGYNPMLLKYLQAGFDGNAFLRNLLEEYAKNIG